MDQQKKTSDNKQKMNIELNFISNQITLSTPNLYKEKKKRGNKEKELFQVSIKTVQVLKNKIISDRNI